MSAKQMVFEAECCHCTKSFTAFVLFEEQSGQAMLHVAEDEEHAAEWLRERLAEVDGYDESGVRRRRTRSRGEG